MAFFGISREELDSHIDELISVIEEEKEAVSQALESVSKQYEKDKKLNRKKITDLAKRLGVAEASLQEHRSHLKSVLSEMKALPVQHQLDEIGQRLIQQSIQAQTEAERAHALLEKLKSQLAATQLDLANLESRIEAANSAQNNVNPIQELTSFVKRLGWLFFGFRPKGPVLQRHMESMDESEK